MNHKSPDRLTAFSEVGNQPDELPWRKARASVGNGACVEVAQLPGDKVAIRDSVATELGMLIFTRNEFAELRRNIKAGDYDPI